MLVSDAVGETLRRLGVDTIFGLIGSGNFAILNHATGHCGIAYYRARHESAAVCMADAYARVTGNVAVCSVHQGPGLTNSLTGLTEAAKSRTPLLLVAGDTASVALGANQDIDQDGLVASVGAGVERIRGPRTAVSDITRAVWRAEIERRPFVVSIPIDLQQEQAAGDEVPAHCATPLAPPRPSETAVAEVANQLEAARRPLIIAGRGAVLAAAGPALAALGERIGALLATSAVGHGLFSGNPFSLGIAGGFASPLAERLIGEADIVLAFGASLNHWTTKHDRLLPASASVVQCDIEAAAIGAKRPVDTGMVADAATTASALLDELRRREVRLEGFRTDGVATELEGYRRADEFEDASSAEAIDPRTLMVALEPLIPRERTVAIDSGHFMGFPAMYLSVPDAAGFVFHQAFQSIGLGLATAIGAALARRDRMTVAVLGDGGAMMSLGELETAVAHRLPMLIVIMNDAAYGAEVHHFDTLGLPTALARFADCDFAAIATAIGARGLTIRTLGDLNALSDWITAPEGPMLLDCKVNPHVRAEWLEDAFRPAAA